MPDQPNSQIAFFLMAIFAAVLMVSATRAAEPQAIHPLHQAAADGDIVALKRLLNQGVNIDLPLKARIPHIILYKNQKVRNPVHLQSTALHLAAAGGHSKLTRLLLVRGANVNASNKVGFTPLVYAAYHGNITVMKLLLDAKANTTEGDPLSHAAAWLRYDAVKLLIERGTDIDQGRYTALHQAVVRSDKKMVGYLLDEGANIEKRADNYATPGKHTPLGMAIERDDGEMTSLLIELGANPHAAPDNQKMTTLQLALKKRGGKAAHVLIEKLSAESLEKTHALHHVVIARKAGLIARLIERGVDINARDEKGKTALHIAVMDPDTKLIAALMKQKPDVNARDKRGQSPLYVAVFNAMRLYHHFSWRVGRQNEKFGGLSPEGLLFKPYDQWSPELRKRLGKGKPNEASISLVNLLLKAGAKVDQPDLAGMTPLDLAKAAGKPDRIKKIMQIESLPSDGGYVNYGGASSWAKYHAGFNGHEALQLLLDHQKTDKAPAKTPNKTPAKPK